MPGDYEFTTLRREILEGRTLEEMEFHWIDPGCDAVLQAGEDESEAEKRQSIAGICCDPENLAAIKEVLSPIGLSLIHIFWSWLMATGWKGAFSRVTALRRDASAIRPIRAAAAPRVM